MTESRTGRAWQFFIVLGLVGATAAVWREPRFTRPEHLVLLSMGIVAAAVAAAAMYRTLLPLVSPERVVGDSRRSTRQLIALEREKKLVLRSIKELEFDKAMGKVADADFDEMVGRLRQRAVGLTRRFAVAFTAGARRERTDTVSASARHPALVVVVAGHEHHQHDHHRAHGSPRPSAGTWRWAPG